MRILLPLALWGCEASQIKISAEEPSDEELFLTDNDGDGFLSDEDCDELDAAVFPGAAELCDGLDNDCDELIDEEVQNSYFEDNDADGFGNPEISMEACSIPEGWVLTGTDCNDESSAVYPTAPEICDGLDNNCNDLIDSEDAELDANQATPLFLDEDNDGFGLSAEFIYACELLEGYSEQGEDCNDTDATINPSAPELCDEIDNDCDELIDVEDDSLDPSLGGLYFLDEDNDGYGNNDATLLACEEPFGYTTQDGDCDDTDTFINPEATELCDTIDNDCDGLIDDEDDSRDESSGTIYFTDNDGDGFGDPDSPEGSCLPPTGAVVQSGDCDDNSATTYPGAAELESSEDCLVDDDGDGFSPSSAGGLDCDDTRNYVNPNVTDIVGDSVDQNCDGIDGLDNDQDGVASIASGGADCDDTDPLVNDLDYDGDGASACAGDCNDQDPSFNILDADEDGFSTCTDDCDDANPDTYPGAALEDGIEGCVLDNDGDGFAALENGGTDCDDDVAEINPTAVELCDTIDNNCNEQIDEGVTEDGLIWYEDRDADGYGDPARVLQACTQPEAYVENDSDCNDLNNAIYPEADEYCNGVDDDCDEAIDNDALNGELWYLDLDGDGYAGNDSPTSSCTLPEGYFAAAEDCDDNDNDVNPTAFELCNGEDDDCDELIDEEALDALTFYLDVDEDGYGGASSTEACEEPSGYVDNNIDCNDSNIDINPGVEEICNAIDDNCNEETDEGSPIDGQTFYFDGDQDGYGQEGNSTIACNPPSIYWVSQLGDCDDGDNDINPSIEEICNEEDDNCDGNIDEGTLGLDAVCPATSCADILTEYPDAENGVYLLDPTGNNSYEAYCDMEAGGWTLIIKSLINSSDLIYDAALWTNTNLLNASDFDLVTGSNSKYPAFNDLPFNEVRIYMNSNDHTFAFSTTFSSMLQAQSSGAYSTTSTAGQYFAPSSYWGLTANGHEAYHCYSFGINRDFYGDGGIARLGFQLSQEYPCSHPGTSEGVGLRERNNNDYLNSGRLQWSGEQNYFASALVFVR